MSGNNKVCNQCGRKVDVNANFCPHCKSESFRPVETIEEIKYKLLYWKFDTGYVISKTKFFTIVIFLCCVIDWFIDWSFAVIGDVITAVVIFVVGYVLHKILGNDRPTDALVNNSDNGLINDIVHMLFYWQDKETGEYAVSKTKIISMAIFYIVALWYALTNLHPNVMQCVGAGCVLGIPALIIGYLIHKFITKN